MSIRLDGAQVFRSIGSHPDAFADARAEIDKQAMNILVKAFKGKSFGIERVRVLREALGADAFGLFLDARNDREVQTFLGKLDKHHPDLKTETANWRRKRIKLLAEGEEPSPPIKKVRAAAKPKAPKAGSKPTPRRRFKSAGMIPGEGPADDG